MEEGEIPATVIATRRNGISVVNESVNMMNNTLDSISKILAELQAEVAANKALIIRLFADSHQPASMKRTSTAVVTKK